MDTHIEEHCIRRRVSQTERRYFHRLLMLVSDSCSGHMPILSPICTAPYQPMKECTVDSMNHVYGMRASRPPSYSFSVALDFDCLVVCYMDIANHRSYFSRVSDDFGTQER